ncbi:hypothetical protein M7I_5709 [Glarea lozoyensis 74030]|nr:hypothetical protein M7I_5709 [Glarea lozoyensis 74030]
MPRPDITALGTSYRRIPLLSIGRSIYNDTRLILLKLEAFYPPSPAHPSISSSSALEKLLETWAIDGGLFARAGQLIPSDMSLLNDEKFLKDRQDYTGRSWGREAQEKGRPEALVEMRRAFGFLEEVVLGDGRVWVEGVGEGPGLADIEAVWVPLWLRDLKGALPAGYICANTFPKTFAWIERFHQHTRGLAQKAGKPKTIKGAEALRISSDGEFAEAEGEVDGNDPLGLKKGQEVEVWPVDSGFSYKDRGRLVGLDGNEVVVEKVNGEGKSVRVHAPRHGFRVRGVKEDAKL